MAAPSRPAVDPGELVQALERRFNDPELAQAVLGGLPAATELPEDLRGPLKSPPWDRLYKWLMDNPEGTRLRVLLQAALNQAPDDRTLRELGDRLGLADEEHVEVIGKAAQKQADPDEFVEVVGKATEAAQQKVPYEKEEDGGIEGLDIKEPISGEPEEGAIFLGELLERMPQRTALQDEQLQNALKLSSEEHQPNTSIRLFSALLQVTRDGQAIRRLLAQQLQGEGEKAPEGLDVHGRLGLGFSAGEQEFRRWRRYLIGPEVMQVLEAAVSVDSSQPLRPADLLSALLAPNLVQPRPIIQEHLERYQIDLDRLRADWLEYLNETDEHVASRWVGYLSGATVKVTPSDTSQTQTAGLSEAVPTLYVPPAAGYISDSVDPNAPDRLGIQPEVEAISRVLMARQVQPPLSLGLFGDWGSGKSFFMAKLRQEIDALSADARALERRDGTPTAFCSRVVQIEFNAWHFADANLWASLVTHIYDELNRHIQGPAGDEKALRQDLEAQLKEADGLVQAAERELIDAKTAVDEAEQALAKKRSEREAKERTLRDLLYDVQNLLAHNDRTREELERAADALGYTEAKTSYDALRQAAGELQTFSKRVAAVGQRFIREPFAWLAIPFLVVVLLVPVIISLMASNGWLDAWMSRLLEVTTLVGGGAAWIGTQIKRATPYIEWIEAGFAAAKAEQERREQEETRQEREALEAAREQERAAREHLRAMQAEYQRLQQELKEFSPSRRLARLIEERSRGTQYREHLGIISLIRQDFQRLSTLLRDAAEEHYKRSEDDLRDAALVPPIQRIILYVDDLDRCRAERVVEVLEAVHLLMAFPLFVVVVGVDPRWLRRCLRLQYTDLLDENDDGVERALGGVPVRSSTPQDYLEKIFQIPFALRPIEEPGYKNLVGELLQPLADGATEPGGNGAIEPPRQATGPSQTEEAAVPDTASQAPLTETGADASPADEPETAVDPTGRQDQQIRPASPVLTPEQLVFTSWEETAIERLAPLFQTPRAVKRFVNIYRLLRSSLPEAEVAAFEGTAEEPGSYRVVLVLLAVVTGFPNLAPPFLHCLNRWMQPADEDARGWADLLDVLTEPLVPSDEAGPADQVPEAQAVAWQGLAQRLRTVSQDDFVPFPAEDLHAILGDWIPRIARYSFFVHF